MSSEVVPAHADVPPPAIQEVAKGVFAYVQLDGSWFLNNAGCIAGESTTLIVDATGTEARGKAWRAAVASITDRPVTTLVNTHHHWDHTNGNFAFAPPAAVVAHENARPLMTRWPASTPLFPGTDFGDCPARPATITFRDELTLWVDALEVRLFYVGPAHTTNDVMAWIPERGVLFTGDVIFNGGTPFAMFGSLSGWLRALDRIAALQPRVIVPGHGAVAGPEVIDQVRDYVVFVREAARRGFEHGAPPEELAASLDLGRFADLCDPERIVPNLHRAYSELRGEPEGTPLPLGQMFEAMVAYNGGRPLRCLA